MSNQAVLALGSNLGDRGASLNEAVAALQAHPSITVLKVSPVVETKAVGGPEGQPDFLNAVVEVATELSPFELLRSCQQIETDHGRVREVRWAARTLDIDIVVYGSITMDEPDLTLPHLRAAERAFVLVPWALMDPDARLGGKLVSDLAKQAEDLGGLSPFASSLQVDPAPPDGV